MIEKSYPISEVFHSFQGEGINSGRAAFFIRTHGCPLHCPWCDSAGTWHPKYTPKNVQRMGVTSLLEMAKESRAELAIITGGEPCIHDLDPLIVALSGARISVAIETSGSFQGPRSTVNCLTVSPKWSRVPLKENLIRAKELKIIVEDSSSIQKWWVRLEEILGMTLSHYLSRYGVTVWLHPEWSQRENPAVLNSITEAVKAHPHFFRAGWQLHKNYRSDLLDARSALAAPLGGNPDKGF